MSIRVQVKPELLLWACERAGMEPESLTERFPKLAAWVKQDTQPTLKQLEDFAKATHTPFGYLFLQEPPAETVPIPDYRTVRSAAVRRPSPDLLETVYICQQRQEWYRDFARSMHELPLDFVGSARVSDDVERTAKKIRSALGFDLEARRLCPTWTEALRTFFQQTDDLGILVMVNGVVGSNNRRKLDPDEFRGFALADEYAPLVFINGADTKAAQMFTLAHELAHLWLGTTALSNVDPRTLPTHDTERWCNEVAAELLVPMSVLRDTHVRRADLGGEMQRLARHFKVSTLVVLRRLHDAGFVGRDRYRDAYEAELKRLLAVQRGSGGDFYLTQSARVGKRFASALVVSTLEGHTLHRDAFRLLGFSKLATFHELGHRLGVM